VIGFFQRWSDARYRRAANRRRTEEIMGWICVPVILVVGWYAWSAWEQVLAERPQLREQSAPINTGILRR
jgi:hypothetical protein